MITEEKIQEITQRIVEKFQPEKIILFGSYAWGKPDADSGVDLFIVKDMEKNRLERQRDLRRQLFPIEMPVDILVYTPSEVVAQIETENFFIKNIVNKGKVLYAE